MGMKGKETNYVCSWCGFNFIKKVGRVEGNGKHSVSSQVQCPSCDNFIKTW